MVDAYQSELKGGLGKFIITRVWELELMIDLQMGESEYSQMPVKERARLIASRKLPEMISALNANREHERIRRQSEAGRG